MDKQSKIQSLIIRQLMDQGQVNILLPTGIALEIGITQIDKNGDLIKSDDYCFVSARRNDRCTLLDSFNVSLAFLEDDDKIIFQDHDFDESGRSVCHVDVI